VPAKVFVQDNASKDNVDRVNEMFPEVLVSKNSYNMGFSKAANNALKQSTAPYIVLLNPDTHVTHGFFECVLRYMEENPDLGIIGPKILNRDGSVQGSARSFPTLLTAFFGRNSLLTGWFPNSRLARQSIPTTGSDGVSPMAFEFHKSCYRLFNKYTKFPLSVVSPLVFWGIALRFFFVLLFHKMR
jgi:cellulose synthase/poly-beta-1,6-N-acetylglucosamine synthase-like glycosyltransferase